MDKKKIRNDEMTKIKQKMRKLRNEGGKDRMREVGTKRERKKERKREREREREDGRGGKDERETRKRESRKKRDKH